MDAPASYIEPYKAILDPSRRIYAAMLAAGMLAQGRQGGRRGPPWPRDSIGFPAHFLLNSHGV
jgi:hypothetical protein